MTGPADATDTVIARSAGSQAKADYLVDQLGFDAAFDYHHDPIAALKELAPEGITVFFDTVGGALYDAASDRFPEPEREAALARGVELLPFSCHHTPDQIAAWHQHFRTALDQGRFVYPRTVVETGIEGVPGAFLAMLRGDYRGNVSVRLA
jgi:NADPH-dependent curcumin reductase CurA